MRPPVPQRARRGTQLPPVSHRPHRRSFPQLARGNARLVAAAGAADKSSRSTDNDQRLDQRDGRSSAGLPPPPENGAPWYRATRGCTIQRRSALSLGPCEALVLPPQVAVHWLQSAL